MSQDWVREIVVSEYARTLIRVKARRLARRRCFKGQETVDDLSQELSLLLMKQLGQFDSERSSANTFVDRVVETGVRMLVRKAMRLKRRMDRATQSLEAGPGDTLRDSVPEGAMVGEAGSDAKDATDTWRSLDALDHVRRTLPEHLLEPFERLLGATNTAVARELGISDRQMHRLLEEIRPYLVRAGFGPTGD